MRPDGPLSQATRFILERYGELLPLTDATPRVTLGEGGTPLVRARAFEAELGLDALYVKLESTNPTGSFKDRGMVLAMAKAVEQGSTAVLCASTGNTSASAAAYAAAYGLRAIVLVPGGRVALGKLAQAVAYGAEIVQVDGSFDDCLNLARDLSERHHIALVNSVNPFRIEGQKTGAFEIVDDLGDAPDLLCIPVGNAGNITAYWRGFTEYHRLERSSRRPVVWGFQAAGAAPLVHGAPVAHPETIATAIRIGNPASWRTAIEARDESGGLIAAVTDDEILDAYRRLASEAGVFCEPASAASLAGLLKQHRAGADLRGRTAVCILTGSGLKDPDTALTIEAVRYEVAAHVPEIERALGLG
ncbi:MAG: threonine synthase [Dehalococcoidia bacterium]|nr:threonine synthase [Dehalococcoidia bacterium]